MLVFSLLALFSAPNRDRWWLKAPVALYAGWLSAATIVSATVTLSGYGVVFSGQIWSFVGIAIAAILAILVQRRVYSAPEYGIAVTWALLGVAVANLGANTTMMICATLAATLIALTSFHSWKSAK